MKFIIFVKNSSYHGYLKGKKIRKIVGNISSVNVTLPVLPV
jgi:hypothetical protein